jgi:putative colanic acid biosynthesis glycosyltransferase WcaI
MANRKRTRLLIISITFDPEPGAMRGLPLAQWLSKQHDYEVEVITSIPWYPQGRFYPGYKLRLWQWEMLEGARVLRVPIIPSHNRSAFRRIITYLSFMFSASILGLILTRRADVVYTFDSLPTTHAVAWILSRIKSMKSVQHIADIWPDTMAGAGMLKSGVGTTLLLRATAGWVRFLQRSQDWLTVLSPGFEDLLVERGATRQRVSTIYNWTYEDRYFPAPADISMARRWGLLDRFNVVYVGNLGPLQAIDTLVHAAAILDQRSEAQIVIAGGGSCENSIRKMVREGPSTNIRFLGPLSVSDAAELNKIADVLVVHLRDLPFLRATIPGKTQVALASGKPVLMAARGDAADVIRLSGAGIVVEPENPAEFAEGIVTLERMERRKLLEMGARGRSYYQTEMSLERGAARMHEIFQRVIGNSLPKHP